MISLEDERAVVVVRGDREAIAAIEGPWFPRSDPPSLERRATWRLLPAAAVLIASVAVTVLVDRPGDWLADVARLPAFLLDPDLTDAVAGGDWLVPALGGGSTFEAIGAVMTALAMVVLVTRRGRGRAAPMVGDELDGVYKIVTNPTNRDDRRSLPWASLAPLPRPERVKTVVCG